jgi:hypothetical protein
MPSPAGGLAVHMSHCGLAEEAQSRQREKVAAGVETWTREGESVMVLIEAI